MGNKAYRIFAQTTDYFFKNPMAYGTVVFLAIFINFFLAEYLADVVIVGNVCADMQYSHIISTM